MRKLTFLASSALLGACSTFSNMETGLNTMVGQNYTAAFGKLGYPSGQMTFGEDTVYAWGRSFSMNMPRYNQTQTTGQVGGTSFSASTGYTSYSTVDYQCNVKIVVDRNGTIKNWEFDGNIGGCDAYSKRLKVPK